MSIALIASMSLLTVQKDDLESQMMNNLQEKNEYDNKASSLGNNINTVEQEIDQAKTPEQKQILEGFLNALKRQLSQLQEKEKTLDLEIQQEQTKYQAVETELESVQQQSNKDIQNEFKIFA